ncbi:MAG: DUF3990 domain-containing protein [Bacteroidales bacterium]|nr:DUF3990 domain-containing protein [Bacteroidales bacterium]
MKVYHATTEIVEHPLCDVGRVDVDFGPGFYVTDILAQAKDWAEVMSKRRNLFPVINVYELYREHYIEESRALLLPYYNEEWLRFVVDCRRRGKIAKDYDYVEGGVANDRVVDTVKFYMQGILDLKTALGRLIFHKPNNQICLKNQALMDKYLKFLKTL